MDFRADILCFRDRLYRQALSIVPHTAEAEDIVQETLIRAWEQRDQWPSIQHIGAWLSQVCKRLAFDRKKRFDRHVSLDGSPLERAHVAADIQVEVRQPSDTYALLCRIISSLPGQQADVLRLRDIEGLSYRQIAEELGLSQDQVRVYLHRARMKVRQQYLDIQNYGLEA